MWIICSGEEKLVNTTNALSIFVRDDSSVNKECFDVVVRFHEDSESRIHRDMTESESEELFSELVEALRQGKQFFDVNAFLIGEDPTYE